MSLETGQASSLVIKRVIGSLQATITTKCEAGKISVLNDEDGACIKSYQELLAGRKVRERFIVELDGKAFQSATCTHIGFEDGMQESLTIQNFLSQEGFNAQEIESVLDTYELRKLTYLQCAQLPATNRMQLKLIAAFRNASQVLILNDPFQPFNGRWRETFARLLVEDATKNGRITVIVNLSFPPQCWNGVSEVEFTDVGKAAEREMRRAEEQAKRDAERAAK